MSTIISSSSYISITEENIAELTLRNTLPNFNAKPSILLFKVKTNIIQNIDVRPSYGYILPNKTKTFKIKYIAKIQSISRTKLQISWISTNLRQEEIENRKMTSNQFTQFYKSQKMMENNQREQYLTIPFKHSVQEQQKTTIKKEEQILDLKQIKIVKQQKNESQTQDRLDLQQRKKVISDFKSITDRNSDESYESSDSLRNEVSKEQKKKNKFIYIFLILIAFGMGVLIGIKIQKLKNDMSTNQVLDVPSVVISGEGSQEIKIGQANNQSNVSTQVPANSQVPVSNQI